MTAVIVTMYTVICPLSFPAKTLRTKNSNGSPCAVVRWSSETSFLWDQNGFSCRRLSLESQSQRRKFGQRCSEWHRPPHFLHWPEEMRLAAVWSSTTPEGGTAVVASSSRNWSLFVSLRSSTTPSWSLQNRNSFQGWSSMYEAHQYKQTPYPELIHDIVATAEVDTQNWREKIPQMLWTSMILTIRTVNDEHFMQKSILSV